MTHAIEELTPDNDPESWAAFQRAVAKWRAKAACTHPGTRTASLPESLPDEGPQTRIEVYA